MDLLGRLVRGQYADARQPLRNALDRNLPAVEEVAFNVLEVTLDRQANEARVCDVLDGNAPPTVVTLDELRHRLDQRTHPAADGANSRVLMSRTR